MMNKITPHSLPAIAEAVYSRKQSMTNPICGYKAQLQKKIATIKSVLFVALCFALNMSVAHAAEANIVSITNPSASYGINIGDKLSRKVILEVDAPYQIETAAFPKKGTKTNGVELVAINVETNKQKTSTRYTVLLSYQNFNIANSPTVMQLPAEKFALSGGDKAITVDVPAWNYWFSPLIVGGATVAEKNLQPQFHPPLIDISNSQTRLAVFFGLLLTGVLGLLYINADGNWLPFMGGAFARAHRQLKRLSKNSNPKTQADEKKALVYVHQAINKLYGANMFARDIDHFMFLRPSFKKMRTEIEQFFDDSNRSLYAIDTKDSAKVIANLVVLSKQLRDCERGV